MKNIRRVIETLRWLGSCEFEARLRTVELALVATEKARQRELTRLHEFADRLADIVGELPIDPGNDRLPSTNDLKRIELGKILSRDWREITETGIEVECLHWATTHKDSLGKGSAYDKALIELGYPIAMTPVFWKMYRAGVEADPDSANIRYETVGDWKGYRRE